MNPEHRRALTNLLMEQERVKMLVSIDQSYTATIVEPAANLPKPSWPKPLLILPIFMMIGAVLGFVLHGVLLLARQKKSTTPPLMMQARKSKKWDTILASGGTNANDEHTPNTSMRPQNFKPKRGQK